MESVHAESFKDLGEGRVEHQKRSVRGGGTYIISPLGDILVVSPIQYCSRTRLGQGVMPDNEVAALHTWDDVTAEFRVLVFVYVELRYIHTSKYIYMYIYGGSFSEQFLRSVSCFIKTIFISRRSRTNHRLTQYHWSTTHHRTCTYDDGATRRQILRTTIHLKTPSTPLGPLVVLIHG